MDLSFTPEEQEFRRRLRQWINENLPEKWKTFHKVSDAEKFHTNNQWERKLYAGGWAGIAWPKEYGGVGATLVEQLIFYEEMAAADAPQGMVIGERMVAPTIMACGTEEQKKRFLPLILSGEITWCQGFSEPDSGSDLASLRAKAEIKGDYLVINGQKIWTSFAQWADWSFALVRTSTDSTKKHKGITYVLIDLKTPGLTIRPIKQITGESEFAEVFFEDVAVPLENVIGEIDQGWYVILTTLMHERSSAFLGEPMRYRNELNYLACKARKAARNGGPLSEDPLFRQKLARCLMQVNSLQAGVYRMISSRMRDEPPGPDIMIAKLYCSELYQDIARLSLEIDGPYSQLMEGSGWAPDGGRCPHNYLYSLAMTIGGGTSEIQRNILAEHGLGLPR